jgi:hypothetical protein
MTALETTFAFIFVMAMTSIPILAIIFRRKPKTDDKKLDALEKRVRELEHMNTDRLIEVQALKDEVMFFHRLLEDKTSFAPKA